MACTYIPNQKRQKLDPKTEQTILPGHDPSSKGYNKVMKFKTGEVSIRHVICFFMKKRKLTKEEQKTSMYDCSYMKLSQSPHNLSQIRSRKATTHKLRAVCQQKGIQTEMLRLLNWKRHLLQTQPSETHHNSIEVYQLLTCFLLQGHHR